VTNNPSGLLTFTGFFGLSWTFLDFLGLSWTLEPSKTD
jgi:hypothetical protein